MKALRVARTVAGLILIATLLVNIGSVAITGRMTPDWWYWVGGAFAMYVLLGLFTLEKPPKPTAAS